MKIRWNRVNRGLVLGLVLGAGTAVYVMVQNAMFKGNIPEISERAEEICQSISENNVGENREGVQRMLSSCIQNNFISKQYARSLEDAYMGAETRSSMLFSAENMDLDITGCDRVYSAEFKQISSSVSKWGIDGANVQTDFVLTCDCDGSPMVMSPMGMINTEWEVRRESDKELRKTVTIKGSFNMIMQKEDGVWKAVTVSYNDPYEMNIEYPEGSEGGEADGQE